ncbi:MAG: hypothetical protein DLM69_08445 [Candidatus Chloroheliales bacterium]|nr:MAG: hypothetical protein DLM69_08445 [Chloroflexota bacterium]
MDSSAFTDFTTRFISIVVTAMPLLVLGVFVFALLEEYVPVTTSWLPHRKYLSIPIASLGGAVVPVCDCGAIPVAHGLVRRGASLSEALAFVVGAPVINLLVFTTTAAIFGPLIAAGRLAATFVAAVAIGAFFRFFVEKGKDIPPNLERDADVPPAVNTSPNLVSSSLVAPGSSVDATNGTARGGIIAQISHIISHASSELADLGRFVIVGAAVAALIQTFVPQDKLLAIGSNTFTAVLLMMLLAFLLSLCSISDAPIAATFVGNFGPGAVLAFMVFGQIIDIKNLFMMLSTFKRRTTLLFIASSVVVVFILGVGVNLALK